MGEITGRCLCGATRYAVDEGSVRWRGHCHCESCRRQTASAFTTFLGVADGHWRWTGAAPRLYRSSPGVERRFCGTCGTPMAYASERSPGEMHFYAATLDDPAGFRPEHHAFWREKMPWIRLSDDLPRHSDDAPDETD
jgi:hypothetical protein